MLYWTANERWGIGKRNRNHTNRRHLFPMLSCSSAAGWRSNAQLCSLVEHKNRQLSRQHGLDVTAVHTVWLHAVAQHMKLSSSNFLLGPLRGNWDGPCPDSSEPYAGTVSVCQALARTINRGSNTPSSASLIAKFPSVFLMCVSRRKNETDYASCCLLAIVKIVR